jgi:hypothetical protein
MAPHWQVPPKQPRLAPQVPPLQHGWPRAPQYWQTPPLHAWVANAQVVPLQQT